VEYGNRNAESQAGKGGGETKKRNWGGNFLQSAAGCCFNVRTMKRPLILLAYEKMIPGTQLVTRLEDLGYEVRTVGERDKLVEEAERGKPMMMIVDLEPHSEEMSQEIGKVRANAPTMHLPIIALIDAKRKGAEEEARKAGATMVVYENVILQHLRQFLEQALELD
jgi:CheY-like chemotaxis protein